MNDLTAWKNGYTFTGIYNKDKKLVEKKADEVRKEGDGKNKAIVVEKGSGYAVYWIQSEENKAAAFIQGLEKDLAELEIRADKARQQLQEFTDQYNAQSQKLKDFKNNALSKKSKQNP